jgi:MFS family permease
LEYLYEVPRKTDQPDWVETLYDRIANEEDARVCKAISEEACREVPGNFFLQFLANSLTKIGDRVASPKTTLAWLLQALGAPAFFTGIIVPIRESGSLLPQLFIAGAIRQLPRRKWVWVTGAFLQGLSVAGLGWVALGLEDVAAGWTIVGLLILFSLARGLCSVASKDVLGKTIPKSRRGLLKGMMSSASGLIAVLAGVGLMISGKAGAADNSVTGYAVLLFSGGVLWLVAAAIYGFLREYPGETEGGGNAFAEALKQLTVLRKDAGFRNFVIVRALAIGSGLSSPFLISLAHGELGGTALWLGMFILVDGLAAMLASPILGKLADQSSRRLLRQAMVAAGCLLVVVIGYSLLTQTLVGPVAFYPAAFFILGIIHSGVRLGRKTYLVDMAEGNQRTTYVAVSNSLIGIILLLAGGLTGLLALVSVQLALAAFAACAFAGALLGSRLPEVSES